VDSVLKRVKTGRYFDDVRDWYVSKYIYPVFERTIISIWFAVIVSALTLYFVFYGAILNSSTQADYVHYTDDITNTFSVMNNFSDSKEDPQRIIESFVLKKYAMERESYAYSNIKRQLNYIKNNSSEYIYKDFYYLMSLDNPDSPVLLYQRKAYKFVKAISVKFESDEQSGKIAYVKFATMLKLPKGGSQEKNIWIAKINYEMSDIHDLIKRKKKKLDFKVVKYDVQSAN
jgi:type IV secretion system protein VirB8